MNCLIIVIINVTMVTYSVRWLIKRKLLDACQVHVSHEQKNFNVCNHSTFPLKKFDVILSYYAENPALVALYISYLKHVFTLRKLDLRVIVYNKTSKINNTILKRILKADIIQLLPNIGRESATYLYHIIKHYDKVADHTLFSQAGADVVNNMGLVS